MMLWVNSASVCVSPNPNPLHLFNQLTPSPWTETPFRQPFVLELLSDADFLYIIGYDTLGWQTGKTWTFVLSDVSGSVHQELVLSEAEGTDAAGTMTVAPEWSPYDEELGEAQAGLRLTGEWQDDAPDGHVLHT